MTMLIHKRMTSGASVLFTSSVMVQRRGFTGYDSE